MSDTLFLTGIGSPPAKLDPCQSGLKVISKFQRNHAHAFAILNSGALHTLDFLVSVAPHPPSAATLNSGVQWALKLRSAWKNEIMRMISFLWKISKSGALAARAH